MTNSDSTGSPAPGSEPQTSADAVVYQVVAARRMQWDALLWQVPALSLTAQAFLFTIALGSDSSRYARVIASALAIVMSVLSLHLMARHRQAEVTDAHWLADYEQRHFGNPVHGPVWAQRRNQTPAPRLLTRYRAFPVWMTGLSVFGIAALTTLALALFAPNVLC
ncbi:hypothetical protein [Streptomyces ossamyceticus]|uniref:hypothetical protein n=1 Tax=Streptomyces ossamyceticus TaxID=249581 RepID=UPI0007C7F814|nr:hypothetical protein [Streptomyces ossamyceticus]